MLTSILEWEFVIWMNLTALLWAACGIKVGTPFTRAYLYTRRRNLDNYFLTGAVVLAALNTAEAIFFSIVVDIRFVEFHIEGNWLSLVAVHFIPLGLTLQAIAYLGMGRAALAHVEEENARAAAPDAGRERAGAVQEPRS